MIRLFQLLFLTLVAAAGLASAADQQPIEDGPSFKELLANSDERSIHAVLHAFNRFRHGIFSTDTSAIEAIHNEDAPLATSLLHLARRQLNNSSTSIAQTSAASTETTTQTSGTQTSTATATGSSTTSTSESTTTSESTPSVTVFTSSGVTVSSTLSTSTTTSQGQAEGSTYTSVENPFTSTYKQTTTLPNGSLSTFTSFTVIQPSVVVGPSGTSTIGSAPGLQTGGAAPTQGLALEMLALVGGAAAVAMVL